jgi:hypothetical protein
MCPDCSQPLTCAKVGDYTISLATDIAHPKTGGSVSFRVGLTGPQGHPVTNARVSLVLSMPGHEHPPVTVSLRGGPRGRYAGTAPFRATRMEGPWKVDVQVRTPKGDVVTQTFTFNR